MDELLSKEEIAQHKLLIEDLEKQIARRATPQSKKREMRKQIRNLKSELWTYKEAKKRQPKSEATYKGAEF